MIDDNLYINNARVLVPDVLLLNGVAHVIDATLNPANASLLPSTAGNLDAFAAPVAASDIPFTSGVPTPTSVLPYEATATVDTGDDTGIASKPRPPVGAIAGGVVGGVAGLALVIVLTWWCMRRKGYKVRLEQSQKQTMTGTNDNQNMDEPISGTRLKCEKEIGVLPTRSGTMKSYRKPELDSAEAKTAISTAAEVIEVHELEPPPKPPVELEARKGEKIEFGVANTTPTKIVHQARQVVELE